MNLNFFRNSISSSVASPLFGLVILKVFLVDLATVSTLYRIVSFLILGVVLLGVSFLYQKARSTAA